MTGHGGRRLGAGRPKSDPSLRAAAHQAWLTESVRLLGICGITPGEIAMASGVQGAGPSPAVYRVRQHLLAELTRGAADDRDALARVLRLAGAELDARVAHLARQLEEVPDDHGDVADLFAVDAPQR